jgi:hypothetical protein
MHSYGALSSFWFSLTGTQTKCHEKATQFSRNTGSEEVDLQLANNDEEEVFDENHVYTTKNFYDNDDQAYLPPTTSEPD